MCSSAHLTACTEPLPKRLRLIPGGHFDPYTIQFGQTRRAARAWFREHLAWRADAPLPRPAPLPLPCPTRSEEELRSLCAGSATTAPHTPVVSSPRQNRMDQQMVTELAEAPGAIGRSSALAVLLCRDSQDFDSGGDITPCDLIDFRTRPGALRPRRLPSNTDLPLQGGSWRTWRTSEQWIRTGRPRHSADARRQAPRHQRRGSSAECQPAGAAAPTSRAARRQALRTAPRPVRGAPSTKWLQ